MKYELGPAQGLVLDGTVVLVVLSKAEFYPKQRYETQFPRRLIAIRGHRVDSEKQRPFPWPPM